MPPGSDERQIGIVQNGHTTYSDKNNFRYLRLIRKYSSIIQGQFFGHLHSDSFRIVYNELGKVSSQLCIFIFLFFPFFLFSSYWCSIVAFFFCVLFFFSFALLFKRSVCSFRIIFFFSSLTILFFCVPLSVYFLSTF